MDTLSIDRFGRAVIPKEVRQRHGWTPGTTLILLDDEHGLRLETAPATVTGAGLSLREGRMAYDAEWLGPTEDPTRELLAAERAGRDARIGGWA